MALLVFASFFLVDCFTLELLMLLRFILLSLPTTHTVPTIVFSAGIAKKNFTNLLQCKFAQLFVSLSLSLFCFFFNRDEIEI